jgi:phosphodiesterase/alkaline phosphatase D-like protein
MRFILASVLAVLLLTCNLPAADIQVLWTQYGLADDTLKLAAHTDADPLNPREATVSLWLKTNGDWQQVSTATVDPLTAMAEFRIIDWDSSKSWGYRVTCNSSQWQGTVRAEPGNTGVLKLSASACINDKWFPYSKAIAQILEQDPDIMFFAGDQIYESNAGAEIVIANTPAEVPAAMANYLAKWRKFGLTYRELLKDRPSIMVTDDHDVYANDLWGRGGRRMTGDRTSGGYRMHPQWVNAAERTQMWHLPDASAPGPWGDGIDAHFTSLTYGGVSFAVLEDRKFKSAPSEVLSKPINDPQSGETNTTLEVIKDPNFDTRQLDQPGLQLLGETQEAFVTAWAQEVARQQRLAAVLSQSPFVNVGNYQPQFGDMDSNGWPQSGRNRALRAIAPSQAVMIGGDIHYGTLLQHGIDSWGDGPWSYSVPAFASNQNRTWKPVVPAQGGEVPGIEGSGNHHDRFGNKLTLVAKADGLQGYGMILFDKDKHRITLELYTLDANREPKQLAVPGWPKVINVKRSYR